jgi:hypothetical protein
LSKLQSILLLGLCLLRLDMLHPRRLLHFIINLCVPVHYNFAAKYFQYQSDHYQHRDSHTTVEHAIRN